MGSSLRRLRIYYLNNVRASRGVLVITLLAAILLLIVAPRLLTHSTLSQSAGRSRDSPVALGSLIDTRPMRCRDHMYEFTRLDVNDKISIIAEFHGAAFYDLRVTLLSVIENTPYDLYSEIIILDDGTKDKQVKHDMAVFLKQPKFNKVRVYSSDAYDGSSASRFKAAAVSTGDILVFVDSSIVVNTGWIQPLLAKVLDNPKLIAVPHYDRLADNKFQRVDDEFVNVFTWKMSTVYTTPAGATPGADVINTPVMRGEVFAVRRSFLEQIGSFDEHLKQRVGVGYHLELSLRAWMCGGSIQVSTCSRIAVRDSQQPKHVNDARDVRRLAELWFGELAPVIYHQTRVNKDMSQRETELLISRRAYLRKQHEKDQCKPFNWYLDNVVATFIVIPTSEMQYLGKLESLSGYCLCAEGSEVTLELCHRHLYERQCVFELTKRGVIQRDGQCLEATDGDRVRVAECQGDSPRQRWWLADSHLTPVTAPRRCLTDSVTTSQQQSSDPQHTLAIDDCTTSDGHGRQQQWHFIDY